MAEKAGRIRAFDWLRGVAVLVMIQTHALVLLKPALHAEALFNWLVRLDGLVAPAFIFTAGFSLALVQVRGARAGTLRAQAQRSASRIGEVLLVATLVNLAWFPIWREPKWLLRVDILHCIGLSLLLVLPLLVGLAARPRVLRWVMLALAAAVFGAAPLFENTQGLASLFLNSRFGVLDATTGAAFPLLPWSGYVFLGASAGASAGLESPRALWAWLGLLLALGCGLWAFDGFFRDLYPPHDFWVTNPANHAQRWTLVVALVSLLRLLESLRPRVADMAAVRFVTTFGTSSLSAYFFHEMLLYFRTFGVFSFALYWREACDWGQWAALLVALEAMTYGCVRGWERLDPEVRALFRRLTQRLAWR